MLECGKSVFGIDIRNEYENSCPVCRKWSQSKTYFASPFTAVALALNALTACRNVF